ncbi:MAG: phosphoribosyltransferase [Minisyncoccia bacterium]
MKLHDPELEQRVIATLKWLNAMIIDDHIVSSPRLHENSYVNRDAIYSHPIQTSSLCMEIAKKFMGDNVWVVIGHGTDGSILAQWTAFHLSELTKHQVLAMHTEKIDQDLFIPGLDYDKLIRNKQVLVVEDILSDGRNIVRTVVEAVRRRGGHVIGAAALVNSGGITAADIGDVPELVSLANVKLSSAHWPESECPLCKQGIPVNPHVGKGREFLERRGLNALTSRKEPVSDAG